YRLQIIGEVQLPVGITLLLRRRLTVFKSSVKFYSVFTTSPPLSRRSP
ncbi:hypothetical protein A2U01_0047562, partial [Trifolium medium]|nr:hypothetical protein [Trifolium medium]